MIVGLAAFIGSPLPMALRLLGVLPDSEDFVFWFVFITGVIDTGLIICFQILVASMMADLVDQSELKTGRRSEGVFFAASTFIRKQHEENLRKLVAVNADKNQ
jgi:GPH family glycoside/pentoside/hexuronide:cation symporter